MPWFLVTYTLFDNDNQKLRGSFKETLKKLGARSTGMKISTTVLISRFGGAKSLFDEIQFLFKKIMSSLEKEGASGIEKTTLELLVVQIVPSEFETTDNELKDRKGR